MARFKVGDVLEVSHNVICLVLKVTSTDYTLESPKDKNRISISINFVDIANETKLVKSLRLHKISRFYEERK